MHRPKPQPIGPEESTRPKLKARAAPTPLQTEATQQGIDPAVAGMQALLRIEAELRDAPNVGALVHLIANETRKLSSARQVFVFALRRPLRIGGSGKVGPFRLKLRAVSSLSASDGNAPLVQVFETALRDVGRSVSLAEMQRFKLDDHLSEPALRQMAAPYPLRQMLWVPLMAQLSQKGAAITQPDRIVFGGLLLARERVWADADCVIAERLGHTTAHAWSALAPRMVSPRRVTVRRTIGWAVGLALLAPMVIPVPMSALAPFEIVARDPIVIAAPIDGVIETVSPDPNSSVVARTTLVQFNDVQLSSEVAVAERELRVADARLKRANQSAFSSLEGRRELAIARGERDVRAARLSYARAVFERTVVRAPAAGVILYGSRNDLVGKPVKTGERLMELADPSRVEARLNMPVADGALLQAGAVVKLFLDSDPLRPLTARITRADYEARAHQGERVTFRAIARIESGDRDAMPTSATPRLGLRGTAQVYGETVPLGLYLFRRPITAVRQWLGL